MAVTLHLRQQQRVGTAAYIVIDEITAVDGLGVGPAANVAKAFLILRGANEAETFLRVATPLDYINYQPYPAEDPSQLIRFRADALVGAAAIGYKIFFPDFPDEWVSEHSGSVDTYSIAALVPGEDDTVELSIRLPATMPEGTAVTYQLLDASDVLVHESVGIPVRDIADTTFRDSVFYSYYSTIQEASNHATMVRTYVASLATQLNLSDEDFNVILEEEYV